MRVKPGYVLPMSTDSGPENARELIQITRILLKAVSFHRLCVAQPCLETPSRVYQHSVPGNRNPTFYPALPQAPLASPDAPLCEIQVRVYACRLLHTWVTPCHHAYSSAWRDPYLHAIHVLQSMISANSLLMPHQQGQWIQSQSVGPGWHLCNDLVRPARRNMHFMLLRISRYPVNTEESDLVAIHDIAEVWPIDGCR